MRPGFVFKRNKVLRDSGEMYSTELTAHRKLNGEAKVVIVELRNSSGPIHFLILANWSVLTQFLDPQLRRLRFHRRDGSPDAKSYSSVLRPEVNA